MSNFIQMFRGCACLGVVLFLSGCATSPVASFGSWARPEGQMWMFLAEIHNNPAGPKHCLMRGLYYFRLEDLKEGDFAIVRTPDGGTELAPACSPQVTRENYVGKATSTYTPIFAERIPLDYWDASARLPGTTRVLVLVEGTSMKPLIPERAILTATLGCPYESLRAGDVVLFWNPAARMFTNHMLWHQRRDGGWTSYGVGNDAWHGGNGDHYPVSRGTYVAKSHQVYLDLTMMLSHESALVASR